MELRCLAGAYAGQVRTYSPFGGLAALRTGMAERIGDAGPVTAPEPAARSVEETPQPVLAQTTSTHTASQKRRSR